MKSQCPPPASVAARYNVGMNDTMYLDLPIQLRYEDHFVVVMRITQCCSCLQCGLMWTGLHDTSHGGPLTGIILCMHRSERIHTIHKIRSSSVISVERTGKAQTSDMDDMIEEQCMKRMYYSMHESLSIHD